MPTMQKKKMKVAGLFLIPFFLQPAVYAEDKRAPAAQKLKMDIGYFAELTKERMVKGIPSLKATFAKRGLDIDVSITKAGTSTPKTPVPWDFAISNFVMVTMQRKNNIPITPIYWAKDCQFEAVAYASSPTVIMDTLKDKKILIYGFGYPTASILRALKEWGLSDATLEITNVPGVAQNALLLKKVDLLVTDTVVNTNEKTHVPTVFGAKQDQDKFKQVAITEYKYPCRALSVASKVSPKNVELIKKVVADSSHQVLKRFDLVNQAEAAKLEATLNDSSLTKIAAKITEYKEK